MHWRDEEHWLELFSVAGLKVVRKSIWVDRWVFGSALEMLRSMHRSGVTGHARVGAGSLRSAMRVYDDRYGTVEGVTATWAWLAVEAVL